MWFLVFSISKNTATCLILFDTCTLKSFFVILPWQVIVFCRNRCPILNRIEPHLTFYCACIFTVCIPGPAGEEGDSRWGSLRDLSVSRGRVRSGQYFHTCFQSIQHCSVWGGSERGPQTHEDWGLLIFFFFFFNQHCNSITWHSRNIPPTLLRRQEKDPVHSVFS